MECDAVREPRQPHSSSAVPRVATEGAASAEAAFVLHGMQGGRAAEDVTADRTLPAAPTGELPIKREAARVDATEPDHAVSHVDPAEGARADDDAARLVDERGFDLDDSFVLAVDQSGNHDGFPPLETGTDDDFAGQNLVLGTSDLEPSADSDAAWGADLISPENGDSEDNIASSPLTARLEDGAQTQSAVHGPLWPNAAGVVGQGNDRGTQGDISAVPAISLQRHMLLRTHAGPSVGPEIVSLQRAADQAAELVVPSSPTRLVVSVETAAMPGLSWRDGQLEVAPRAAAHALEAAIGAGIKAVPTMAIPWTAPQAGVGAVLPNAGLSLGDFAFVAQEDLAAGFQAGLAVGWHSAPSLATPVAGFAAGHGLPVSPEVMTRQLVEAVVHIRDDRIEIALSPEELGTMRMTLTRNEAGGALTIWVERPEVLEAMRRNVDLMQADLNEAGLGDLQLEFRDGSDRDGSGQGRGDGDDDAGDTLAMIGRHPAKMTDAERVASLAIRSMGPDGWRLDIRV